MLRLTPFNGPLLDTNDATTSLRWSQFGEVDEDLRTGDTDGETADDSAGDEMTDILSRTLEDSTDDPDDGGNLKSLPATELVGKITSDQGADEGTSRHGGRDASLFR